MMHRYSRFNANRSRIFDVVDTFVIGLEVFEVSRPGFFSSGMILPVFIILRNRPVENDRLARCEITAAISDVHCFKTETGTASSDDVFG
jgi:hypothetical protein